MIKKKPNTSTAIPAAGFKSTVGSVSVSSVLRSKKKSIENLV